MSILCRGSLTDDAGTFRVVSMTTRTSNDHLCHPATIGQHRDAAIAYDPMPAFPEAPMPKTMREALSMLEETRRLLAEECRQRAALRSATEMCIATIISNGNELEGAERALVASAVRDSIADLKAALS